MQILCQELINHCQLPSHFLASVGNIQDIKSGISGGPGKTKRNSSRKLFRRESCAKHSVHSTNVGLFRHWTIPLDKLVWLILQNQYSPYYVSEVVNSQRNHCIGCCPSRHIESNQQDPGVPVSSSHNCGQNSSSHTTCSCWAQPGQG